MNSSLSTRISADERVIHFIKRYIDDNKWICALCSAGAKVLATNGLLGRAYTTGGRLQKKYNDGRFIDSKVVVDNSFISAKGLGVVFEFSLTVAEKLLVNVATAEDVNW